MYRMTGYNGHYDKRGNNKDNLIKEISQYNGVFVLWAWRYNHRIDNWQWIQLETFIF